MPDQEHHPCSQDRRHAPSRRAEAPTREAIPEPESDLQDLLGNQGVSEMISGTPPLVGTARQDGAAADPSEHAALGFQDRSVSLPFRAEMEDAFDADFGDVSVHTGPWARAANELLDSEGYAHEGRLAFATPSPSRELVAHELAHIVQDRGEHTVTGPADSEKDADQAASAALAGLPVQIRSGPNKGPSCWKGYEHHKIGQTAYEDVFTNGKGPSLPPEIRTQARDEWDHLSEKEKGATTWRAWMFGWAAKMAGDKHNTVKDFLGNTPRENSESRDTDYNDFTGDNYNHTREIAALEWRSHHERALELAEEAQEAHGKKKKKLTSRALLYEAFASHFLEDAFASGHQPPRGFEWRNWDAKASKPDRKKIHGVPYHNEMNSIGMPAENGYGEKSIAYGDGSSRSRDDSVLDPAKEANTRSLKQLQRVLSGEKSAGEIKLKRVSKLMPRLNVHRLEHINPSKCLDTQAKDGSGPGISRLKRGALYEMMRNDYADDYAALQGMSADEKSTELTTQSEKTNISAQDLLDQPDAETMYGLGDLDRRLHTLQKCLNYAVNLLDDRFFEAGKGDGQLRPKDYARHMLATVHDRAEQAQEAKDPDAAKLGAILADALRATDAEAQEELGRHHRHQKSKELKDIRRDLREAIHRGRSRED